MTQPGDDTSDTSTRNLSRTLQYDTPASTTTGQGAEAYARRSIDYKAMNDLMRKDLAEMRETKRRERAQMMVALARCEELEA